MLTTTSIVIIVTSILILLGVGFFLLWWFLWRHKAKKVVKMAKIKKARETAITKAKQKLMALPQFATTKKGVEKCKSASNCPLNYGCFEEDSVCKRCDLVHSGQNLLNCVSPDRAHGHPFKPAVAGGCIYDVQCAGPPCGACDLTTGKCGACGRVYKDKWSVELCQAHCGAQPGGPPVPPSAQKYTCDKCKCIPWKGVGRYFEDSTCDGACQEAPDCRISYQGYERQSTADMCSAGNCSAYNCKAGDDSCFCMHKCSTMKHPLNFDCSIQGRPPPCPKGGTSSPYFPKK
jgi:hypothetical protein